jgi:hypothetical protein
MEITPANHWFSISVVLRMYSTEPYSMLNLIFAACSKQLDDESSWLKMSVHWFIRNQILARMRHETSRHQSIIRPCLISLSQQESRGTQIMASCRLIDTRMLIFITLSPPAEADQVIFSSIYEP